MMGVSSSVQKKSVDFINANIATNNALESDSSELIIRLLDKIDYKVKNIVDLLQQEGVLTDTDVTYISGLRKSSKGTVKNIIKKKDNK
jgi:DNA-binding MltR family transcriptional regulator